MTALLTKTYAATADVAPYRIVKFSADYEVAQATSDDDASIGVADGRGRIGNDRCDVHRAGLVDVEYGGVVTRAAPLTSDASGRAIVAAPAAGTTSRVIGFAEVAGVEGDIGRLMIQLGQITTPAA
jgi:hypothetical protein